MNVRRFYGRPRKNWTAIPAGGKGGESDDDHLEDSESEDEYVPPQNDVEYSSSESSSSDSDTGKWANFLVSVVFSLTYQTHCIGLLISLFSEYQYHFLNLCSLHI